MLSSSSPSRAVRALGALVALLTLACTSHVIDAFSSTGNVSQTVGPEGGQVTLGSASVRIPASALATPTAIGLAIAPASGVPTLPASVAPAGKVVALTPHGASFGAPVTIHVPFDQAQAAAAAAAGRSLAIYTAVPGGAWAPVAGVRAVDGALEADVTHFSYFVVGFEDAAQVLRASQSRKVDLLFLVDDSLSMAPLQQTLISSFPGFMQFLKSLPGGLPDVHIGVVSSSMGAGAYSAEIPNCGQSMGGLLQSSPQVAGCAGPHDAFIAAGENETTKNYDGTIEDTFSCIAALGDHGCGFEQQFEAMAVALGARGNAPPENAGFLRDDALLGLVMMTNEDDCSVPPGSHLYDPSSRSISDEFGQLASYRCNEFGHVCAGGVHPPRTPPDGGRGCAGLDPADAGPDAATGAPCATVTLDDCHSAEDGVLNRVSDYVQLFKGLKPDPSQVFISAIAGPPTPYVVQWSQEIVYGLTAVIGHSCVVPGTDADGDPAVRITDLLTAFGANGTFLSICADSFVPTLTTLGAALAQSFGPACLQAAVVDPAAAAPAALRAGCAVYESVPAGGGLRTESPLPACAAAGAPCWSLQADATCTDSGAALALTRTDDPPPGAVVVVRCSP